MGYKPQMIHLYRSPMARLTGSKKAGEFLLQLAMYEKPYISEVTVDEENQVEHWQVEYQFWLKNKDQFKNFGYIPLLKQDDGTSHLVKTF